MKMILSITSLLLLALSVCLWIGVIPPRTPGIITKISPDTNCTSFKCDYSNTQWEGKIDARLAAKMANNYKADEHKSMISIDNSITPVPDARSVWFPLESLKSYIWAIESQTCSNAECKHKEALGLRIYYAKYPDASSQDWLALGLAGLPITYANRHTIFMVPTYYSGGHDFDFDPWSSNCASSSHDIKSFNPADTLNQIRARSVFFGDPDGKNHGGLIPPGGATGTSFN